MNQEIKVFDVVEGDYNDVFDKYYLKGTVEQIEQYIKSEIEDRYSEEKDRIEESNSDDIGFQVWQQIPEDMAEEDKEDWYPEVEYGISANILEDSDAEELLKASIEEHNKQFFYHKIVDLTQ